jgi:hypothetical protein
MMQDALLSHVHGHMVQAWRPIKLHQDRVAVLRLVDAVIFKACLSEAPLKHGGIVKLKQ